MSFRTEIEDKLRQSDEVIAIVSEHSAQSHAVNFEIGAALALGKRVTPIVDRVKPKDLPPILRSLQAVDVSRVDRYLQELSARAKSESESTKGQAVESRTRL